MDIRDLKVEILPINNPDWDFARTRRVSLRRPQGEWASSVFSVPLNIETLFGLSNYVVPNRDFKYEGLFSIVENENWKFLEALPVGIFADGKWFELRSKKVVASPWKVVYGYEYVDPDSKVVLGFLDVKYYLMLDPFGRSVLSVEFSLEPKEFLQQECLLLVDPLVKIRHMYESASPWEHHFRTKVGLTGEKKLNFLEVQRRSKFLLVVSDFEATQIYENPREVHWTYSLGDGTREKTPEGFFFKRLEENLLAPATFGFRVSLQSKSTIRILAICSNTVLSEDEVHQYLNHVSVDEHEETVRLQSILDQFSIATGNVELDRFIAFRILALFKFGMNLKNYKTDEVIKIPEAGAWWFRTPWLRDVYEGLFNNFSTFLRVPGQKESIRKIILATAQYQDPESGRIPNKIPEFKDGYESSKNSKRLPDAFYNCVDATLLFAIVARRFIKATDDVALTLELADSLLNILESFEKGSIETVDGPPVIVPETGLLLCVPNHTWTDSQYTELVEGKEIPRYPSRVPISWVERSSSNPDEISKALHKPKYYLPEINAQWILALDGLVDLFGILVENSSSTVREKYLQAKSRCSVLLARARLSYKQVFWNAQNGFLFNIVSYDLRRQDAVEGSPALVAVALISELFSEDELAKIWAVVRDSLLVRRSPVLFELGEVPFGVLSKNSTQRIYYGDRQYHEAVVWPRDTPYLIKLLTKLNMRGLVEDILVNNLDHQMSECVLFFNNELFSLAEGKNPYPNGLSSNNPVPVKNPIQWWSQWVDPYISFYGL
jgi:glycogen debranching enzyme